MAILADVGLSLEERWEYARSVEAAGDYELERERCRFSIEWFADHWVLTFNPKDDQKLQPFNLFPKQREFLKWLTRHERKAIGTRRDQEILVEKCREMGATWLMCLYAVHGWLYRAGYSVGFGSRKLDFVDTLGNPDSIFEKIRILLRELPPWLLPKGFKIKIHAGHCKILNPETDATITGEGGDNIGRGGRKTLYVVDEAAFLERPELADSSLMTNCALRVNVSTPNGPGNPFAQKRFSFPVERVFTLSWRDDPRKDEAWHAHMKATTNPVLFAQNVEIDYTASIEGICIPAKWVQAAVELPLPKSDRIVAGADVGEFGDDPTVLVPRSGPVVLDPVAWGQMNTTETAWRLVDEAGPRKVQLLNYDVCGIGSNLYGTWQTARNDGEEKRKLPFAANGVNSQAAPSNTIWPDGRSSKELLHNLRAEMWWLVRARFEKAYEFKELGLPHPAEEMISIPNHPQLIAELSMPLKQHVSSGKIKIESKEDMRKRGVKSPNYADALVYSFAPEPDMNVNFRFIPLRPDAAPPPGEPTGPRRKAIRWFAPTQSYQPRPLHNGEMIPLPDFKTEALAELAIAVFHRLLGATEEGGPDEASFDATAEERSQVEQRVKDCLRGRRMLP